MQNRNPEATANRTERQSGKGRKGITEMQVRRSGQLRDPVLLPSFVRPGQQQDAWSPCLTSVFQDGSHTHTQSPGGADTNHTEGIPPGDRQKPRGNSKRFSRTKNRAHKTKQREFHQGTSKNPRQQQKSQGRKTRAHKTTQREFHQGTAKNPRQLQKIFKDEKRKKNERKKPSTQNQTEGIPPGDRQKTPRQRKKVLQETKMAVRA